MSHSLIGQSDALGFELTHIDLVTKLQVKADLQSQPLWFIPYENKIYFDKFKRSSRLFFNGH